MCEARSAIHIRTGQRALVEALDAWLGQHHAEMIPLADAFDACVYLLKQYARIPDLALIGADWLGADEFNIVSYVRQTWPRTGIVVYGGCPDTPLFDVLPMVQTCRSEGALRRLMEESPAEVLGRLGAQPPALAGAPGTWSPRRAIPGLPSRRGRRAAVPAGETTGGVESTAPAPPAPRAQPHAVLTAEELAALLGTTD